MKYTQKLIKNHVQRYAQNYETEIGTVCIQQEGEAIISLGIVTPRESRGETVGTLGSAPFGISKGKAIAESKGVFAPWGTACQMATEAQRYRAEETSAEAQKRQEGEPLAEAQECREGKPQEQRTKESSKMAREAPGGTLWQETPLLKQAVTELEEYLAGERREFPLPLHTEGTPFQERVWEVLRRIPYGQTLSYGQVAALAGSPKGARAAGMACHCNPIMVFIPCHRVVGSDGSLTGFGGGLAVKEKLLALERKI